MVTAVADRVLPPFGAAGLLVQVIEGDRLRVVGAVGYPQSLPRADRRPAAGVSRPLHEVVQRSPAAVHLLAARSTPGAIPRLAARAGRSNKQAWAFLPLVVSGRLVGLCMISFDQPRRLSADERALLTALSGLIAQALERARLYDAEHARAQELQRAPAAPQPARRCPP